MDRKLKVTDKLGYGAASMGDAISYAFLGTFLMFFLTTVAGIQPAIAGTISIIGTVWDATYTPIMGYLSDKIRTKYGKRRPLIFIFAIPLGIVMFLLFTAIDIPASIKPAYYGLMLMLFWTCFTGFFIPHSALGTQYTKDYNERTILRLYASFFNSIGGALATVLPTIMVEIFMQWGETLQQAWSTTAGILGLLTSVSILITVLVSKKFDPPIEQEKLVSVEAGEKFSFVDIFREFISIAKLKPVRWLVLASALSLIGQTVLSSDMMYYFTYNLGLSGTEISACMLLKVLLGLVMIPVVAKAIVRIDKRETLMLFYGVGCVGLLITKFIGNAGIATLIVFLLATTISTSIYWQLVPSVFYDVCEYDKFTTGKHREASIISFQSFIEAIAAGVGSQLLGIILQISGFNGDSAVQNETALTWLENLATFVPIMFFVFAIFAFYKYPITKKMYDDMVKSNEENNR